MSEEKDQVGAEVIKDDKSQSQSKETAEELTLEKVADLAKGLQKGYTLTRQDIADIKGNLSQITEAINVKTGAQTGEDEYLTVGKLREILSQQNDVQEQRKAQADTYIDNALEQLKVEGKIKTQEDEDELLNYALKIKEPDLLKAAAIYDDIKKARSEGEKNTAKAKAKQEEGSKVGTSSKADTKEQGGVSYSKMKKMSWYDF